jgi:hypothetical protein
MSNQLNNAIFVQLSSSEYQPADPGGPNYIGAVDYPKTVYNGYIGSTNYMYEPRSLGYGIIDDSDVMPPVAKMPKTDEFKELNLRTVTDPVFGECSIPTFFQTSEDSVRRCSVKFGWFIFKIALLLNLVFSIIFYKQINKVYVGLFIFFHLILYYFLTRMYTNIAITEWKTIQTYKYNVKKNNDYSMFDSPIKQFREINDYMRSQTINRTKILYGVLIASIMFVWIPLKI